MERKWRQTAGWHHCAPELRILRASEVRKWSRGVGKTDYCGRLKHGVERGRCRSVQPGALVEELEKTRDRWPWLFKALKL